MHVAAAAACWEMEEGSLEDPEGIVGRREQLCQSDTCLWVRLRSRITKNWHVAQQLAREQQSA